MPDVIIGPRCNRRVTCDASTSNARSESAIAVNPLDAYNLVGSSKRFTNPATYAFSLAAYASFNGGQSWTEAAPLILQAGWAGTSDPAVAWDNLGNAYLVALPFGPGASLPLIGIAVYKSSDGGRTWGPPTLIHSSSSDDKQWAAGDINPASPYYGNVYAAWDNGSQLAFARTTDHGATWKGVGAQPVGTALANDSFAPSCRSPPMARSTSSGWRETRSNSSSQPTAGVLSPRRPSPRAASPPCRYFQAPKAGRPSQAPLSAF